MLQIKEKTKKIISIVSISGMLFVQMLPLSANALTIPDDFFNGVSSNLNTITGPLNSADNDPTGLNNKQQGPKVEVTFNSAGGGQAGSLMTANAVPSFFNNNSNPKDLYFTWYLKRSACDKTDTVNDGNKSCDLDGNDKVNENDWKIAAAKIIIKGSFDNNGADYNKSIDEDLAAYKAVPSPLTEWSINSGDESNDSDAPNCYVQEPDSGLIYEMRRVNDILNDCPDDAAGNSYHRACVSDQTATCDVLNPEYTQENIDAAILAGDPLPEKTISNNFGTCAVSTEDDDNFECKISDYKNFKTKLECDVVGEVAACVKDDNFTKFPINATYPSAFTTPLEGIIFGKDILADVANKETVCKALAKPNVSSDPLLIAPPNFLDNTQPNISADDAKCSSVKDKLVNGTKDDAGNVVIAGDIDAEPTCSFEKSDNMCKHLFPVLPSEIKKDNGDRAISGDGDFSIAEKKFWGADPNSAKTNGVNKDEEAAVGLGVDKFSWMFSPGDQVGVVVEGDSAFPTSHNDSSFKRMWAFSSNTCSALDDLSKIDLVSENGSSSNKDKRGFYLEGSGTMTTGFLTAEVDLNDCLEENLLDPDVNSNSKLTVQLNATPQNPINDSNGRGDVLSVVSGATNTQNSSGLLYKWSVQKSRDGSNAPIDTTSWMDITSTMQSGGSFAETDLVGLGKKDLNINLNMSEAAVESGMSSAYDGGAFYLKVKLKITGSAADGSQNAEGSVIVRVNQQGNEMLVYPATATDNGMLSLNKGLSGQSLELCSDQQGKTRCYVTKNQIVGLEVIDTANSKSSNLSWTVNGNPIECKSSTSSQCIVGGRVMFVPVLGNEGEAVDVVAKGMNDKNESIEISRHFVITKAGLQITSSDPSSYCGLQCLDTATICPKYLGFYKDLGGGQYPDCSNQVWQTTEGKTVTLGATGQTGFDWAVDGQIIPEFKDQNQIQLKIDKMAGESYNIGLSTHLLADNTKQFSNTRLALYRNWGVTPEDVVEENQNANIQLDVISGSGQAVSSATPTSFGASLITHLPEQLMFLLKISLTSVLLLLVTGVLFAFIPETLFKEEGK